MTTDVFREFFYNEELDFKNLGEDTIVIFDTNTLLNIYRYSNNTREKLIKAINNIKNNIWMPYQVGLEFNLNRRNVIEKLKKGQEDKKKDISEIIKKSINVLGQRVTDISLKSTDAKSKKNEINDFINEGLTTFHNELAKKVDELYKMLDMEKDLASEIAAIFEGKIGKSYTQEQLDEKLKDAATRYERNIPPGYQDANKNSIMYYNGIEFEQKYGDLIVWNQILDKASAEDIQKVVFVTDDNKEDWWYSCENKTFGPRAELKNEMYREAKADFYMLNANSFLNNFSDSEDTKDLIENEVPNTSDLEKADLRKKLKLAIKALDSNTSPLNLTKVDKEFIIESPIALEAQPVESINHLKQKSILAEITMLEKDINGAKNFREHLLNELREIEKELEKVDDMSMSQLEDLYEEKVHLNDKLKIVNNDLNLMRYKHRNLKLDLNALNKLIALE